MPAQRMLIPKIPVPKMPGGIRFRITAIATVVVVVVLVVTGMALVVTQRRTLTYSLEETLHRRSDQLVANLVAGDLAETIVGQGDDDSIAQVIDEQGRVIAATENFMGQPPLSPPTGKTQLRNGRLPVDESTYRLLARRVDSTGGVVIHVGTPIDDIEESVAALRRGLIAAVPAVALLLAVLVWFLVGRTLRPVEAIRSEVADITGSNLHRRVPELSTGDEISRLARTMNAMLDRVENAAQRQQRFVADASHELRSPLTRIRSELEVDRAHPETANLAQTRGSVFEEILNLQRLVDDLLLLARSDIGTTLIRQEPVDLDDLVLQEVRRLRSDGSAHVDVSGVSAAQVVGDPAQLTRAVRNLGDNALRHARTRVVFSLQEHDGVAELAISDDGPGVPDRLREQIFERFARADDTRNIADGGAGLGLAITRDIIERHGGTVHVDPDHTPGARFVILIPTVRA